VIIKPIVKSVRATPSQYRADSSGIKTEDNGSCNTCVSVLLDACSLTNGAVILGKPHSSRSSESKCRTRILDDHDNNNSNNNNSNNNDNKNNNKLPTLTT
jgi:hypothetical protein